ncbi:MAG: YceI family protein [Pseudonocardiales bacterium]
MTRVLTSRWELVNSLSCAGFTVRNLGVRPVRGQVPIRYAWVDVDEVGRPLAVHAELDLAGIDTSNPRRDGDLRKPRLLATDRFPTLTFTAGAGEADGDSWRMPGRLAAHGTETDVVLTVSSRDDGDRVTVHATTTFDRRALNVRAPRLMIGAQVAVTIEAVLRRC